MRAAQVKGPVLPYAWPFHIAQSRTSRASARLQAAAGPERMWCSTRSCTRCGDGHELVIDQARLAKAGCNGR